MYNNTEHTMLQLDTHFD